MQSTLFVKEQQGGVHKSTLTPSNLTLPPSLGWEGPPCFLAEHLEDVNAILHLKVMLHWETSQLSLSVAAFSVSKKRGQEVLGQNLLDDLELIPQSTSLAGCRSCNWG
jgi:hypothetical protein